MVLRLPESLLRLLGQTDGMELKSGGLIYGSRELVERNATYEVAQNLPGHVAIGDDGGGQMFLLREGGASPVLRIDMGAIGSLEPDILADSIEAWVEQRCPSKTPAERRAAKSPSVADVLLVAIPGGKLSNLIALKKELDLDLGIAEFKALATNLPARLLSKVPYAPFRARCDALNARFGMCLSLIAK